MSYSRVMCLVRGEDTDADVIRAAVDVSSGNNREIHFVHVIVIDRMHALDTSNPARYAEGERMLRAAEQASGVRNETKGSILQARAIGPVLVREALDFGAEVIVLSAKIVRTLNSRKIDADAEYLMANAPCAVILVRDAVQRYEPMSDHPLTRVDDYATAR